MRRRTRQGSPRLLPRDATGGVQERLVTAGLVDRPEVTRVARRAKGDRRDAVAGVDVRVRKNAATGAGTATTLQRQDTRRSRDVQIVPLRIRWLVLQDHDRVAPLRPSKRAPPPARPQLKEGSQPHARQGEEENRLS